MVTSSNGSVTGPWCVEFTGHRSIPLTKASDAELWYFLWTTSEQTVEQTMETPVVWDAIAPIMTHNGLVQITVTKLEEQKFCFYPFETNCHAKVKGELVITFLLNKIITNPCPIFNGSLAKSALKLGFGWVITSRMKGWFLIPLVY